MATTTEIKAHTAMTVCESIGGTSFRRMPPERGEAPDLQWYQTRGRFYSLAAIGDGVAGGASSHGARFS